MATVILSGPRYVGQFHFERTTHRRGCTSRSRETRCVTGRAEGGGSKRALRKLLPLSSRCSHRRCRGGGLGGEERVWLRAHWLR
eukprot:1779953-Rhodomonas_salina.1